MNSVQSIADDQVIMKYSKANFTNKFRMITRIIYGFLFGPQ